MELQSEPAGDFPRAFPFARLLHKGGHDLLAGGSTRICRAFARLPAEGAPCKAAVGISCEHNAKALQPRKDIRRVGAKPCDGSLARNAAAAVERFTDM